MNKIKNFFKKYFGGDPVIWFVFLAMCVWSVIAFFSASSKLVFSDEPGFPPIMVHLFYLLVGIAVAVAILHVPIKIIRLLAYVGLILSFGFLIYVIFKGQDINEAKRWVKIGFFRFQPSELAKLSLVIVAADMLSRIKNPEIDEKKIFWWLIGISSVICGLIFVENLSTAALLFSVIIILCFVQKISWKRIGIVVLTVTVLVSIVFIIAWTTPKDKLPPIIDRAVTWVNRIKGDENNIHGKNVKTNIDIIDKITGDTVNFSRYQYYYYKKSNGDSVLYELYSGKVQQKIPDNLKGKVSDKSNERIITNEQAMNSKIAIARGMPGKFPGNSIQRKYLTYAYADYIYAIIIEDTGLIGGIIVIALYLVLLFRAGRITTRSKNVFTSMLVVGLSSLIVMQALIHMLVVTGFGPVTGQALPIFSRGGTSAIITCIYFGIILNVTRQLKKEEELQKNESDDREEP